MRIYIDTETSGLSKENDHVIEIAAVVTDDEGNVVAQYASLARPPEEVLAGQSINKALEINRITKEELALAPPAAEVASAIGVFLEAYMDSTFHAYNVAFDAAFLCRDPWNWPRNGWGECVMLCASQGGRWMKLGKAANMFGLEWPSDAHRALADALMAARVHQAILTRRMLA